MEVTQAPSGQNPAPVDTSTHDVNDPLLTLQRPPSATWSDVVAAFVPGTVPGGSQGGNILTGTRNISTENSADGVIDENLQDAFTALAARPALQPTANATRLNLDVNLARTAYGMYIKVGIILFRAEETPLRDRVMTWAETVITNRRQIAIRMIREIAKKHYLILVGTEQDRETLLKDPPKKMDGKAIMMSPWSPKYDYKQASKAAKQIWIELPFLDPLLTEHGRLMAETLGTVLFHSSHDAKETNYLHLRACIMREDTENLQNAVILDLPWGGHVVQEVKYTRLPESCFRCSQRGHKAVDCPNAFQNGRRRPFRNANQTTPHGKAPENARNNHPTPKGPGPSMGPGTTPMQTSSRQKRQWKPKTPSMHHQTRAQRGLFGASQDGNTTHSSPERNSQNRFAPLQTLEAEASASQNDELTSVADHATTQQQSGEGSKGGSKQQAKGLLPEHDDQEEEDEIRDTQPLSTLPLEITEDPNTTLLLLNGTDSNSLLEVSIVAKRRALMNRGISPHEEMLQDGDRT
ncbi:hypothetical protein R1sor_014782 [Riccia sorocarpa]|uniref:CCHC-type domain-containing protein n=1 Tax=Riccia sorocarpa TaxID=122646 RepID=A0ABD3HAD2_9MARC